MVQQTRQNNYKFKKIGNQRCVEQMKLWNDLLKNYLEKMILEYRSMILQKKVLTHYLRKGIFKRMYGIYNGVENFLHIDWNN